MYQFEKIKLVIWDLDETLWQGTLSEGHVYIPDQHSALVKRFADIGIVNSICSKNDPEPVERELDRVGLLGLFVFPSVNWQPKGERIRQLIADMQLRAANVLFLDDNPSNLNEALFVCPELMTAGPEAIPELLRAAMDSTKEDQGHQRLAQYRVLEQKREQKERYSSNEAFLFSSDIRVTFGKDCMDNLERIHDLVWRSNQLNFTKVRATQEELKTLLEDEQTVCGYICVKDRFGDYGITGFYALRERKLLHFCFSCRTLGMGIEQYVYNHLGRPELKIVGEVISDLSGTEKPAWINQESCHNCGAGAAKVNGKAHSVLIKGPCDLFQILPYIADRSIIDTEFTYVAPNGTTIESTGHTTHIVEALRLADRQKKRVMEEVPFLHEGIYRDSIYRNDYKVVVLSILADANLGVYQRKGTGERFAFVEGFHPLTDPAKWEGYISGEYSNSSVKFTRQMLQSFAEKYEFVGINTPEKIVDNLRYIRAHLPQDCTLAVMLGGELCYEKNTFPAYADRHLRHKAINDAIRAQAAEIGLELIDVNRYLVDQSSFYDHFNHYIKPVYYQLAGDIVDLINQKTGQKLRETGKLKMVQIRCKEILAPLYYKLRKLLKK